MFKIALLSIAALLFTACSDKPKCDSNMAKELVMEKTEKKIKTTLALKLVKGAIGDEWVNIATDEERAMVDFNYGEYGPVLEDIGTIKEDIKNKTAECSAKLIFRNGQKFDVYCRLQKDSNGKLHADVTWN